MGSGFNQSRRQNHRDIASRRFNVPVRKQGGGAGMGGAFSVLVNQFVQRWRRRHHIQQEDNGNQQPADKRLEQLHKRCF